MSIIRIGKRKLVALVAVVVLGATAVAFWRWWGNTGLLVVTLAAVVGGVGAVAYLVVSAERRIRGEMAFFAYSTRELIIEIEKQLVRPGEQNEALMRALNASYRRLEEELVHRLREPND